MGHRINTCKNNMCACAYGNGGEDGEVESEDEIITYGSTQVKNLGCNFFGFEDMGNHLSDWDYNDLTARIEVAGASSLSDIF